MIILAWLSSACSNQDPRTFCHYPWQDNGFAWATNGHRLHIFWGALEDTNGVFLSQGQYEPTGRPVAGDDYNQKPGRDIRDLVPKRDLATPVERPNFSSCERKRLHAEHPAGGDAIKIYGRWFAENYVREALEGIPLAQLYVYGEQLRIDSGDGKRTAVIMGVRFPD